MSKMRLAEAVSAWFAPVIYEGIVSIITVMLEIAGFDNNQCSDCATQETGVVCSTADLWFVCGCRYSNRCAVSIKMLIVAVVVAHKNSLAS
jgi:hypothetical protein